MGDTSYNFFNINHKMNSLSRTQSSDNESLRGDMSYLYGRDPSILAYGQRPFPSQESKKNLISLLEEEKEDDDSVEGRDQVSTSTDTSIIQTVKVFLRMKPFPRKMKLTEEQSEAYSILNSTTLLTKLPSIDTNTSCLKKLKTSEVISRKFIFTQTFGPETTQLQLFEEAVKPQMIDFLAGKNSVVMSYGTTNSGKTYTLQGTAESPGIIPRGIEFVFSHINPRPTPSYKPVNLCDIICLNNSERLQEMDTKMKLLTFNTVDKNYHITTYKQMQQLLHEESPMKPSNTYDAHYSVWISFAEIYNETIYDLLWNDCQKKRPALKLSTDSRGRAYIKGLKIVCVNSGAEAYQVLMAGQYNLKVAATALNSRSSRSHCIFTIKLLKYKNENDPRSVDVSMFSFCDLAGSERLKKTLNVGERLKEAQNINTSLLVLGRCLKTIYESQCSAKQKNESIGPFRESKFTRLFQRALSGKEQIALIVNVNPVPNLYIETQNVLNFSAIAKKIVIERTDIIKRRRSHSRFSRLVTQSLKTDMDWENTELDAMTEVSEECTSEQVSDLDENDQEAYEDLLAENELLKNEIKELKASVLSRDMQTRQEMASMYSEMMKDLEADWKNRLTDLEEQQEDLRELAVERIELFYKEKLSKFNRKRSRSSIGNNDDDDDKQLLEDLETENSRLVAKIETMKKSIYDLKQHKETAETEKTKISFELTVAKEELKRANEMLSAAQRSIQSGDDVSDNYIEELNNIITQKDDRIKTMKTFLNDAKEEYISITELNTKLEKKIEIQGEELAENMEHIQDLEEQLSQANICSAEQNNRIERLEEELEQTTRKLAETEEKLNNLSESLATGLSESDKNLEATQLKEFEETKLLLEQMKRRFEFSEEENLQLKQKLNERVSEIQLLKNNLDSTKNQLDNVTEKVNNLTIEDPANKEPNLKTVVTVEQEIQTEFSICMIKELTETVPNIVDISCQTSQIENLSIETYEKCSQTSFFHDQTLNKEIKEEIENKSEAINMKAFQELQKQCEEIQEALEACRISKAEVEKEFADTVSNLQTQISTLIEQEKEKTERIATMQKELESILKTSEEQKQRLKASLEAQEMNGKNLLDQITKGLAREQEKDNEITGLQKEMKSLIQSNEEVVKRMETEIKNVLKECALMKEELTQSEAKCLKMDKEYKQVIHILETRIGTLEHNTLEKQMENEKLKMKIEETKRALDESELELEVFTRNRNETVTKYEDLVKQQYEDISRCQKEITRLQDLLQEVKENTAKPTPLKGSSKKSKSHLKDENKKVKISPDTVDNTSEDDHHDESRIGRTRSRKQFLTPTKDNIPLIELSGSESKRSVKSATKEPVGSTRRTRKKRLFTPLDESYVDIEQGEPSPSPNTTTRNLRNRRK